MKIRSLGILTVSFYLLAFSPDERLSADDPPYQAIVTEITGKAEVRKKPQSKFRSAVWGMHLHRGDQIRTGGEGQISILFSSHNMITLGPNSSITISDQSLPDRKYAEVKSIDPDLSANLKFLAYREKENDEIGMLAGLRGSGDDKILLVSPRNTKIKTQRPSFHWQTTGEYEKFEVTLFDRNGRLWTKSTSKSFLQYPEDEPLLNFNTDYFWYVEGENLLDSDKSEKLSFGLIAENRSASISDSEKRLHQQFSGSNFYFLIANIYENENLNQDALQTYQKISEYHPDAPLPHHILGKIYQRIGLKDKAIEHLERAVELTQKQNQ